MTSNQWLLRQSTHAPDFRLFCFPYAGGGSSTYMRWNTELRSNIEVVAVQLPGRSARISEPPLSSISELMAQLLPVLEPLLNVPYILFGHSLGAKIAFELCVQCKLRGLPSAAHFFASGSPGPGVVREDTGKWSLSDAEFVEYLKKLNGTPSSILENKELLDLCLPGIRADFKLSESFITRTNLKIDCPTTIIGGQEDQEISFEELCNWKNFVNNECNILQVPGDHFFIDTHKYEVLEIIKSSIYKI